MKNIIIGFIIFFLWISVFQTFQIWEPIIYINIEHNKTELSESIETLQKAWRIERIIALSDSIIANLVKAISPDINNIKYSYYYLMDYCIDYYQKKSSLKSMSLSERNDLKISNQSWKVLAGASTVLWTKSWPYVNQDYRLSELNRIEKTISK